jgi:hypothetical protein
MKIIDIRLTGLAGGTVDGGWPEGMKAENDLHTLVEVLTDEGLVGVGSVYTSKALTAAAVQLLRPLFIGERIDEPAPARSSTPSAAWTSPCGTCSARSATSPSRGCWAAIIGSGSSPTDPSCSRSRRCSANGYSRPSPAASRRSSSAGVPSAAATARPTNC